MAILNLSIRRTDKRFTGSDQFKFVVDVLLEFTHTVGLGTNVSNSVRLQRLIDFDELRRWCIQTWDMSCERGFYLDLSISETFQLNEHWCWHTENEEFKIYLKTDKEANWFKLKWL